MANSLKGKVVLITGASSGFGEDAARLFAAQEARVVLAARRVERLQALAAEIKSNGGEAFVTPVDITQRADIDRMVNEVIEHYGQIDILFNNAGFGRLNWFDQLDFQDDIQTQMNVNLIGLMQTTQAVLPHMIKKHMRKSQQYPQGDIVTREGTIHVSNVMKAEKFDARAAKRGAGAAAKA